MAACHPANGMSIYDNASQGMMALFEQNCNKPLNST